MKKLLIALFGTALILGACGGADEPAEETPAVEEEAPAEEEAAEETAAAPEELYSDSCASCHGADLEGAVYPESIAGVDYDKALEKLQDGHGGLDGDNAERVAEWISAQ